MALKAQLQASKQAMEVGRSILGTFFELFLIKMQWLFHVLYYPFSSIFRLSQTLLYHHLPVFHREDLEKEKGRCLELEVQQHLQSC